METKKCPRCGAEIPVEMSFCLHCMERTDGVLEIKRKTEPSRKMILSMIVLAVLMIIVIILLIMVLSGKGDGGNMESFAPYVTTETIKENTTTSTTSSKTTVQTQTQSVTTTEQDNNYQESISEDIIIPPSENENPVSESPTVNNDIPEINFEDIFTERLNNWAGSRILTDTLSFNGNECTFNASVGIDKVKCTVTANSEMTCFTLDIEPDGNYMSYSTSIYVSEIINEITYFVLDYQMSNDLRTDISKMFENFESSGNFSENNFSCDISTTEHNNGSYPINVSCSIN